jgi:hypothetical protein
MPPRTESQRNDLEGFAEWCTLYGIPMPASGEEIAHYLMDLLADGESLPEIQQVEESIRACYERNRVLVDWVPVRAALKLAAAQLKANRVIN